MDVLQSNSSPPQAATPRQSSPAVNSEILVDLRGVSLTSARGRSYALIGRTGSGKSTLAKVLTRAVDVPRGTVFLGGTDIDDLDVEGLRRWTAIVPPRTELLAGTLADVPPELLPGLLRERLNESERALLERAASAEAPAGSSIECVNALKRLRYERELAALQDEIERMEQSGAPRGDRDLDRKKTTLIRHLEELKG